MEPETFSHCELCRNRCTLFQSTAIWSSYIASSISLRHYNILYIRVFLYILSGFGLLCFATLDSVVIYSVYQRCDSALSLSLSIALFFVYHSASFDIHILLFMYVIPLFKVQNTHKIRNLFVWKFVLPAHIHKICILYLLFFVFVCALFFTCMCCVCVCVRYIQRISVTFWDVYVWKIAKRMKC